MENNPDYNVAFVLTSLCSYSTVLMSRMLTSAPRQVAFAHKIIGAILRPTQ